MNDVDESRFGDTWAYDPATNTWANLNPAGEVPSARSGHSMVYDPASGKMILFGGRNEDAGVNDTWAYDPSANTWTNLNPSGTVPSGRYYSAMVYDRAQGKVILFGGRNEDAGVNDTWAYDPSANTWTELTPSGASPSARINHQMVYDSALGKVILFGGWWDAPGVRFANPWAYDPAANTWTELAPVGASPSARSGTGMVYDSVTGKVILFGGWDGESFCADTWSYDPTANTWVELTPTGDVPAARGYPAMVYDPGTGRVVLFGGWVGDTTAQINLNDTWAYGVTP
jgi:N-acetylneuraminic acid mutarotase